MDNQSSLIRFIKNEMIETPNRLNNELTQNGTYFNHRNQFKEITEFIDEFIDGNKINRYLVLPGLRGVGKSTLLFQTYNYLLKEKNITPKNILYLSGEILKTGLKSSIMDAVKAYLEEIHNVSLRMPSENIFLLIDEAQYDKNWSITGKIIFDSSKNIFMIFTGSSALNLEYNADSARRLLKIPANPLNYQEHLKLKYNFKLDDYEENNKLSNDSREESLFKNNEISQDPLFKNNEISQDPLFRGNKISQSIMDLIFKGKIDEAKEIEKKVNNSYFRLEGYTLSDWDEFLKYGGFPFSFYQNNYYNHKKYLDIINRVITIDMKCIGKINSETQTMASQLLYFLALQKPGEISKNSMANYLECHNSTVKNILETLEKTHLIFHLEPYSSSPKRGTKSFKYYFATPSLRHALALSLGIASNDPKAYEGVLLENLVASSLFNLKNEDMAYFNTFYDSKNKKKEKKVDFIIQRGFNKPIPIEVGIGKKGNSQIRNAINKYKSDYGIIISNASEEIEKEDNIIKLPLKTFSLM